MTREKPMTNQTGNRTAEIRPATFAFSSAIAAALLTLAATMALLLALGPDWSQFAPASCRSTHCFCETPRTGELPEALFDKSIFQSKSIQFLTANGYGGNIKSLQGSALGAGHFTQQPDRDGVVRRVPMLVRYEDKFYGSLALEVVRRHLGADDVVPRFEPPLFNSRGYPG